MLFSDPTGSGIDGAAAGARAGHRRRRRPRPRRQPRALQARDSREAARRAERDAAEGLRAVHPLVPHAHLHPRRARSASTSGATATRPASRSCSTRTSEEVRSGHDEEPPAELADASGGAPWPGTSAWRSWARATPRRSSRWSRPTASRSRCALPVEVDRAARRLRLGGAPVGVPWHPGLACVTAHDHGPDFRWQRNFQVRGDLVEEDGAWAVVPRKLVGGFELPPGRVVARARLNVEEGAPLPQDRQARAGRARALTGPEMQIAPAEAGAIKETRTSRLRCALVSRSVVRRGEPHNLWLRSLRSVRVSRISRPARQPRVKPGPANHPAHCGIL